MLRCVCCLVCDTSALTEIDLSDTCSWDKLPRPPEEASLDAKNAWQTLVREQQEWIGSMDPELASIITSALAQAETLTEGELQASVQNGRSEDWRPDSSGKKRRHRQK